MASSTDRYAPVFLPGEYPPWQRSLAGQSTVLQRVRHNGSNPACIDARLFLPVAALPQQELSMNVAQLLGLQGPWAAPSVWGMNCLYRRSYCLFRLFFQASYSWRSEGLFGQFFSIALPIQALRGLPCLGSFPVVWCLRHLKGHPVWGPIL